MIPDFNIFALRINKENSTGQKILHANRIYYILKGYYINHDKIIYDESTACMVNLYNDYVGMDGSPLHVNISAIVGANGSGKSSLVEFILRLMNNFAASLFGEEELHPEAEHLHFIDGVYGELYFILDKHPHLLKISGDKVELYEYNRIINCETQTQKDTIQFTIDHHPLFFRDCRKDWKGKGKYYTYWRKKISSFQKIANHIFYTFVSNYSLYAYNTQDYINENNSQQLEKILRHNADNRTKRCWLDGIFHKNDGYQTPIVLTPYREKGNININRESILSNDRLISLLLMGKGFVTLNSHLQVLGFELIPKSKTYDCEYLKQEVDDIRLRTRAYNKLKNKIVKCWAQKYNCSFDKSSTSPLFDIALNYLASKTIKVAARYKQYRKYFQKINSVEKWVKRKHLDAIDGMIDAISRDQSHITTRIRQTLCFLTRRHFDNTFVSLDTAIAFCATALKSMKEDYEQGKPLMFTKKEDVLPAPFFEVRIRLQEKHGQSIYLDKLSSGEKQQINSISSILYHLSNIDSVHLDLNNKRVSYKRVLIILEEIELYYHPALQKEFIKFLLDGLKQLHLSEILAISILVVTHSPFVLSDIPTSNIIALKDGDMENNPLQSFGANIHDLLKSSFFLNSGSRGLFAEWIVKEIIKALDLHKNGNPNNNQWLLNYPREKIHKLIMTIDEPIIQRVLLEQFRQVFKEKKRTERILELQAELERLNRESN